MPNSSKTPVVILTNPQMGENIGAAARAMLNFGMNDLRLVNPRDSWPNKRAEALASGALDTVEVQVFDTLEDALFDVHCALATTARDRDLFKDVYTPQQATNLMREKQGQGDRVAYVFGAEQSGLSNEELSHCHGIITIVTNPDFSSLNLAQSVLLIVHEHANGGDVAAVHAPNPSPRATQEEMNNMLGRLETELESRGFFHSQEVNPGVKNTIRNIFLRSHMYEQETRTMHGVISTLIREPRKK